MPAAEQSEQTGGKPSPEKLRARIGDEVIHALGKPRHLHTVQVHALWGNCFRVNILAGEDGMPVRISHSYFLVVGEDGAIVSSTPRITREY